MKTLLHLFIFFVLFSFSSATVVAVNTCTISGDSSVCENDIETYLSGYSGAFQYSWGAFGGSIIGSNTLSSVTVNWGYAGTGQLTMIVKDSLNNVLCTKIINVSIGPKPKPAIIPSFASLCNVPGKDGQGSTGDPRKDEDHCLKTCDSTWVTYSTANNPGSTYTWIIVGSSTFIPSGSTVNVYWTTLGIGTVKVIETNIFGCSAEHEICVNVIPRPNAAFTANPAPVSGIVSICLNQTVYFSNLSTTNGGSPIYSYEWDFGDGNNALVISPNNPNVSNQYVNPGTYTVTLVVTNDCGCKDTATLIVVVDANPGPDIFCISTVCPGTTSTYSTSAICSTYVWTATNGTIVGPSNTQTVTVTWNGNDPTMLSLTTPCSPCPTPSILQVPVIPPNASYSGDTVLCFGECKTYKISCAVPVDSIIWHIPAGLTLASGYDTINEHTVRICAGNVPFTGVIWVEYFHKSNGSTSELACGGNVFIPIHVRPTLFVSAMPEYCENDNFTLYPFGAPSGNIQWTITNGNGMVTYASIILPITSNLTGSWIWGPGNFIVTAVDLNNKHCNKKVVKNIKINPAPPQPTISGPAFVCPNSTHSYTGIATNSLHAISWQITGGNPANGLGNTVNVTWNSTGPYVLYAYEINPITGCKSIPDTFNVQSLLPLTPATINGPDTVCSNGTANYSTTAPADNYEWSINPSIAGSVGSGQFSSSIQVQLNNYTGNAWVVLKRTLCNQTRRDSVLIYIRPPQAPVITAPAVICEDVSFSVNTSTIASTYAWNFGDGGTASGNNPSHVYNNAGNYIITLTVNYGGNCPTNASTTANIIVNPAPIVNISTADPTRYCDTPPPSISTTMYIASSIGTISYNWYRSPSTTSLSTSTSYTATQTGSYYAICTNTFGCSGTSNVITIDSVPCDTCTPQTYSLNFNRFRLGCNRDSFNALVSANVGSLGWNFGDIYNPSTNSATGTPVTHNYTEPGIYVIQLCGKIPNLYNPNDSCIECITKSDTINYVPDFFYTINCVNYSSSYTVSFINITKVFSLAPTPVYSWSINGGVPVSGTNYTTSLPPGTYTVTLFVNGICSISKSITIVAPSQASFTVSDSVCVNAAIQFNNTSGTYLSHSWDFGDGATSLAVNPYRSYSSAGTFIATLNIINQYGCLDSSKMQVVVLPNTLSGTLLLSGPATFCLGDSVIITVNPSGGYAPYSYLWTNAAATPSITAYYTGNYGVDIYDGKQCFYKVKDTVVLVNPIPNTTIIGKTDFCLGEYSQFKVALPNTGYVIDWTFDGVNYGTFYGNTFGISTTVGPHTVSVTATSSFGCSNTDSFNFNVHPNPNVSISSSSSLCQGDSNILVATSTSANLVNMIWSTGLQNDTLITKIPKNYSVEVTDSNGCKANAVITVHPLPDLCGLMTGCYEICDTVTDLVWHAPKGYASYQWYYNGVPIPWATSDTFHIPLYQSGTYNVGITSIFGCQIMSEDIEIDFIKCGGCLFNADVQIQCGPVNALGYQTYNVTFNVNNSLPNGASIAISSPQGTISSLSPAILNNGMNTVTAMFTDIPAIDVAACFTISIWNQTERCDTSLCIKLPPCASKDCKVRINVVEPFSCIGFDGSGNPQYYGCINANWGGSNGSTMTLVSPNATFSPNTFTVNNGNNTICFTYTDLPPVNFGSVLIHAYFFDSLTELNCRDSFKISYKPCQESCLASVTGLCAHCERENEGGLWTYTIEMDVFNGSGSNATVSIVPISAGVFGPITPNPIPPGYTTISTTFTDLGTVDTIICFRIVLTNVITNQICYRDICVNLPPCDDPVSVDEATRTNGYEVYPNPAKHYVSIRSNDLRTGGKIELIDNNGKLVKEMQVQPYSQIATLLTNDLNSGLYMLLFKDKNGKIITTRIIIE